MSKVDTDNDTGLMPQYGKWEWKDVEVDGVKTGTLEYISSSPTTDHRDRNKGKGKQGGHHGRKNNERAQSGLTTNRQFGVGKGVGMQGTKSPTMRQIKRSAIHSDVTLQDIKSVAWDMVLPYDVSPHFENGIYKREQFDEFVLYLMNYFHWFFEKRTLDLKPNPMNIEPSAAEKKLYAETCVKLQKAQKLLGQFYCVLVLGLGLEDQHHMACGSSRVSATYQDRSMYESLYNYCSYVIWITFRRREYEIIRKELGRILRSDTFNPAIRVKNAPPENEEGEKQHEKKLTPAEYRRLHPKRPAIKSIINQRSPAVVAILPSPKEEADYLFKRKIPLSPNSIAKKDQDVDEDLAVDLHSMYLSNTLRIGIIGEPLSNFNTITLAPLGSENDEGHEEGEENANTDSNDANKNSQERISRGPTAMSHATTEAFSEEENE